MVNFWLLIHGAGPSYNLPYTLPGTGRQRCPISICKPLTWDAR